MTRPAIIVTGLPASGKSTVARALETALAWPALDKDDFLEKLLVSSPIENLEQRRSLSRQSDQLFREAAEILDQEILVSHWRPISGPADSGTATEWVNGVFDDVIEVYCHCDPVVAAHRFLSRRRHPGHLDNLRTERQVKQQMQALRDSYPLDPRHAIYVSTQGEFNPAALARSVMTEARLL